MECTVHVSILAAWLRHVTLPVIMYLYMHTCAGETLLLVRFIRDCTLSVYRESDFVTDLEENYQSESKVPILCIAYVIYSNPLMVCRQRQYL